MSKEELIDAQKQMDEADDAWVKANPPPKSVRPTSDPRTWYWIEKSNNQPRPHWKKITALYIDDDGKPVAEIDNYEDNTYFKFKDSDELVRFMLGVPIKELDYEQLP